jgi:hypothetical protein
MDDGFVTFDEWNRRGSLLWALTCTVLAAAFAAIGVSLGHWTDNLVGDLASLTFEILAICALPTIIESLVEVITLTKRISR